MGDSQRQTTTLLDAIVVSLVHAARFNPEDQVVALGTIGTLLLPGTVRVCLSRRQPPH